MSPSIPRIPVEFWQPIEKGLTNFYCGLDPVVRLTKLNISTVYEMAGLAEDEDIESLYETLKLTQIQVRCLEELGKLTSQEIKNNGCQTIWDEISENLTYEEKQKLAEFRGQVDLALQQNDLEFIHWSLAQQKTWQRQIKTLESQLQWAICQSKREPALEAIEAQKQRNNSPIWLVASQIIKSHRQPELTPLQIFFSPPTVPDDRINSVKGDLVKGDRPMLGFPAMNDYLAESLRDFVKEYTRQGRNIDFMYGAWTSQCFHSEAATQFLKFSIVNLL